MAEHAMERKKDQHDSEQKQQGPVESRPLGNFLLTHYTFALESDPKHAHSPKVSAAGLPPERKYRESFLGWPYGIKMQGTGLAEDGHYIKYAGNDHYAYGVGGAHGPPVAWKTVAVDPKVIPLGSKLIIDAYKDKGVFEARDTGGAIHGQHLDVFAGAIPIAEAYALGTKHSEVRLVTHGGEQPAPSHGGGGGSHDHPAGNHGGGQHHGGGQQHQPQHTPPKGGGEKYVPAPTLAEVKAGHAFIRRGMEGDAVAFVQRAVAVAVDGQFGPITEGAVKEYQRKHGLEVDGVVGTHTLAAMEGHGHGHGNKPAPGHDTHHGNGGTPAPDHEPPAASGSDPVAIARKYVTHPPTPSIKLKGKLPHFTAAGGETNDCADFVSSVLETAGRISGHHINVGEFKGSLLKQGWRVVQRKQATPGDVWMNYSLGHTELVSGGGGSSLIGSNNDRPGHQVVTETSGWDGIYLHKDFGGGGGGGGGEHGHKPQQPEHHQPEHHPPSDGGDKPKGEGAEREVVMEKARSHLGARYYWGADGPSMFDCSGFAWYVLHTDTHLTSAGRTNAAGLSGSPYTIPEGHVEKGDLVFYHGSSGISHVTIATGEGSTTIGASGGGPSTHGDNPNAKVKYTDWNYDSRGKSFGSIRNLIAHRLGEQK